MAMKIFAIQDIVKGKLTPIVWGWGSNKYRLC